MKRRKFITQLLISSLIPYFAKNKFLLGIGHRFPYSNIHSFQPIIENDIIGETLFAYISIMNPPKLIDSINLDYCMKLLDVSKLKRAKSFGIRSEASECLDVEETTFDFVNNKTIKLRIQKTSSYDNQFIIYALKGRLEYSKTSVYRLFDVDNNLLLEVNNNSKIVNYKYSQADKLLQLQRMRMKYFPQSLLKNYNDLITSMQVS